MASLFIPGDLILDGILPWLPAKSIGRFRCICKSWYHQTTNPSFKQKHQELAVQRNQLSLFMTYNGQHMMLKDRLSGRVVDFHIHNDKPVGSCNGIVCFLRENQVYLLNPCTGEFKLMEFPYQLSRSWYFYDIAKLYGFGYDSDKDDYKMVLIYERPTMEICIHSLNNTSCHTVSDVACQNGTVDAYHGPGVYVNGRLYWLGKHREGHGRHVILYFDIKNKVLQDIEFPAEVESAGWYVDRMAVFGGKLCISSTQASRDPTTCIQIWVMQQHSSWTKLFSLDKRPSMFSFSSKAYLSKKGEILLDYKYVQGEILLDNFGEDKLMYHPQRKTIRLIQLPPIELNYYSSSIRITLICPVATLTTLTSVGRVKSQ